MLMEIIVKRIVDGQPIKNRQLIKGDIFELKSSQ
jgi:hypothetical protein